MVKQLYDVLLHKLTKHTNTSMPFCRYISGDTFPSQITDLLNTDITLKYRDQYFVAESDAPSCGRPSDDTDYRPKNFDGPEYCGDEYKVFTDTFRVIRADSSEPFRLIAISKDYKKILVNSTRKDPWGNYAFKTLVSQYGIQDNTFFGLDVNDQYAGELNELKAVSVRVDSGEPCYSVMLEFLGATKYIRFILGDEAFSALNTYFDPSGDTDYNNATAKEEANYIDVDGYFADHRQIAETINVDGGYADNLFRELKDKRAGRFFINIDRYNFIDEEDWLEDHYNEEARNLDFEDEDEWHEAHLHPEDEYHDFPDEDEYYEQHTKFMFKNYNFYNIDNTAEPYDETNKTTPPTSPDDIDDGMYDFGDVEGPEIQIDLGDDDEFFARTQDIGWENYNFSNIDPIEEPMDKTYKIDPPYSAGEDDSVYDYGDLDEGDTPSGFPKDLPDRFTDRRAILYEDAYDMSENLNPIEERSSYDLDEGGYNFGDLSTHDNTAQGDFNFWDLDATDPDMETDSGIFGTAEGDYEMEENAPEEKPDDTAPDEGKYNFGDVEYDDGTAEGDYDMNMNPESDWRPYEQDDNTFDFSDIDDFEAEGDWDFGELTITLIRDDEVFNFGDEDTDRQFGMINEWDFGDLEEGAVPETKAIDDYDFEDLWYEVTPGDIYGEEYAPDNVAGTSIDYDFETITGSTIFNFGEESTGDYDMNLNPECERHPEDEDEGVYNFGDISIIGDETAVGNYDFGDLDDLPDGTSIVDYFEFEPLVELTDDDRASLIKQLMEGKVIYGSV